MKTKRKVILNVELKKLNYDMDLDELRALSKIDMQVLSYVFQDHVTLSDQRAKRNKYFEVCIERPLFKLYKKGLIESHLRVIRLTKEGERTLKRVYDQNLLNNPALQYDAL